MSYSSDPGTRIYQVRPPFTKPSSFRPKGWTETVAGYINEAKQLTMCIMRNRKLMNCPYSWVVHLNIADEMTSKQAADQWTKTCRSLRRQGIVLLWIREPNRSNKVHYHMIVRSAISRSELEQAIEEAMPSRKLLRWRKRIEPIRNEFRLAHYITKAKIIGYIKGQRVTDFHRTKRLLFRTDRAWKKYGVIGAFWVRPKKRLWHEIRDHEKAIADGLAVAGATQYANLLFDIVDGYFPLKTILRSVGRSSFDEAVRRQIDACRDGTDQ